MTFTAHLTDELFAGWRERRLTAAELLDVDTHLAACAPCRARLYTESKAHFGLRSLQVELSGHLDHSGIAACSEGLGNPGQLAHIRRCTACQAEVLDLSHFRTEIRYVPRRRASGSGASWLKRRAVIVAGAAAGILLFAIVLILALTADRAPRPSVASTESMLIDPAIPQEERAILERAIYTGALERAPLLDKLRPAGSGSASREQTTFVLVAPVGSSVLTDRPLFRWSMLPGATGYTVSISDDRSTIAESPVLTDVEWQPSQPLPRGKVLYWHVTARTNTGSVREPAETAPQARFQVLQSDVVERIEAIRRGFPGNPLLLAAVCAHEGALDEADAFLVAMDRATARSYRESLARIRRGE